MDHEKNENHAAKPNEGPLAVGNYQLSANIENGLALTISGYTYHGDTLEDINARIDRDMAVASRLRAKGEIKIFETNLAAGQERIERIQAQLAELDRKKAAGKLATQEQTAYVNLPVNLKQELENIEKGKAALEDARKRAE